MPRKIVRTLIGTGIPEEEKTIYSTSNQQKKNQGRNVQHPVENGEPEL